MNYKVLLAFLAGVGVGVGASWRYLKKYYSDIADEDIASVKREWARKEAQDPNPKKDEDFDEKEAAEYAEEVSRLGYNNKSEAENVNAAVSAYNRADAPYVIPPEEFGEVDGYDQITLWHHEDGVLADENDERVEDVGRAVGDDYADHFGEYDDNAVYIRNDRLKVDYEILLAPRKYSEVLESKPYLQEE